MAIIRKRDWDPFRELNVLQHQISDLFDWSWGKDAPSIRLPEGISWSPSIDVEEDEREFSVKAEVPGLSKDDLSISVDGGVLRISGEKKVEKKEEKGKKQHISEIAYGKFERILSLPETADTGRVNAKFKDGTLKVTITKKKESQPKQIDIKIE
ncbi:MAG: Hsp20/alpha crystallin family protein [bacterium]|nr:Hsp20/alpha crystallin family protein [bacterium]